MTTSDLERTIKRNLDRVETQLQLACDRAGRARSEVILVAVSKQRSLAETMAACACGVRNLGENRVEELSVKVPAFQATWRNEAPTWHMIGHLQSRKVRDAVRYCQILHSLDSISLATKLDTQAANLQVILPVLVECNVSAEPNKYGFAAWQRDGWPALGEELSQLCSFKHLQVRGLMTMAPIVSQAEETRPYFRLLGELRSFLSSAVPQLSWRDLSMGMTDDYQVAVEEGATMVRIGRAIFDFHQEQ